MTKVLIIDDEMDICFLLSKMLAKKHVDSQYANSIADATTLLNNNSPDMVFLDNHLSDGRGIDFAEYIKHKYPETRIIMISAFDNFSDRKNAKKMGIDDFIGKPFSSESIDLALSKLGNTA